MLTILARDIKDQRFLKLIRQLLKAGYLEDWKFHNTYSGVPQGGVVSPLLANLVLNELDQFVEQELLPHYNKGIERRKNPAYQRLDYPIAQASQAGEIEQYRQLKKKRQQLPCRDPYDPDFRWLKYVRYGDDFILGYAGTRQEALEIKQKIQEFLNQHLHLTLSAEKP